MNVLELLATKHKDWCRMVRSFGCPDHLVEDVVQEMYLRMHKYVDTPDRIMYGDEPNTYFVYVTLRNMYADYVKTKNRSPVAHGDLTLEDRYDLDPKDQEESMQVLVAAIWAEVKTWHWYDEKMFTIYIETGMSMRELEAETKISLRSIFNTLTNAKSKIQANCSKEYQDYRDAGNRPW